VAHSNLTIRLATAAVVSPLILMLLFLGPVWGWQALILASTAVATREVLGMTHPGDSISQFVGTLSSLALSAALYWMGSKPALLPTVLFVTVAVGALLPLWRLGDINTAGLRMMSGIATPLYIGLMLCTLTLLRRDGAEDGPGFVLLALMFAWLGDTGGYFAGRFLGKTPLYKAVSPKKTREGLCGSLIGAVVGGLLAHFWYLPSMPLLHAVGLGLVAGLLGQLGDLAESLLKRSTGLKDSGNIVPGHGGMLDRIDALLLVSPTLYLYLLWR
jgi:phosphatidate cytidylyltransferase